MKKFSVLIATALLVAACGGSAEEATDTTASASTETTVAAETTTTAAATTSTEAETTTTAAESTTTAVESSSEAKGLDVLLSATEAAEMTSARIEGVMAVEGASAEGGDDVSFEVPFSMVFDIEANALAMTMDMSGMTDLAPDDQGMPLDMFSEIEIRQIGEESYVKMPFLSMLLGDSDVEWIQMPPEDTDMFTGDMGVQTDPYEMLDEYRQANADVEELGVENVNGVDATHYRVTVDGESYYNSLSDEEKAQLEAEGPLPTGEFPIDLWISDDGYVVRMVIEIDGSQAEVDPDEQFDRMTMTYDVFDINEPVDITAPDEFVTLDDLGGAFGDLEG